MFGQLLCWLGFHRLEPWEMPRDGQGVFVPLYCDRCGHVEGSPKQQPPQE